MKPIREMNRAELSAEFRAFLAEARRRGDTRNGAVLISEWVKFRQRTIGHKP